jgi:hypothetical protein
MAKAKDNITPSQRATIKKMELGTSEERAALQKKMTVAPELRAFMQKVLAKRSPEELAKLDKMHERLDRYIAIGEGLIPPPWAEKLLKPAAERKAKPKPKSEKKPGPAVRQAISILIEVYPPTGIPPDYILRKTVLADVNKVVIERNKALPEDRKEPLIKADSLRRATHALKERNAP